MVSQEETIELTPIDGDRSRFGNATSLFRSRVTTMQTGVDCEPSLNVGTRIHTAVYEPEVNVVFDCVIGDGVVSSAVSDVLRSGAVGKETLNDLVCVKRIEATHGTRALRFMPQPIQGKDGCYLFPFFCCDWPEGVVRVDRLEVEISSVIDMAMGWYTFFAPKTVTDRLTVSFRTPFRVACLLHEPLRSTATKVENDFVSGAFLTRVRAEGPVAAGTRIIFVFRRNDGE